MKQNTTRKVTAWSSRTKSRLKATAAQPGTARSVQRPTPAAAAREDHVQHPVGVVEGAEPPRLRPPRALGEDDRPPPLGPEPGEQAGYVLGVVLAVAVHEDHGPAWDARLGVGQSDGDGPL